MNPIIFFISENLLLILLILHSCLTRGGRITLKFFLYAFIFMSFKEIVLPAIPVIWPKITSAPMMLNRHYRFLITGAPDIAYRTSVVIGWLVTFYLSWHFSEKIVSRFAGFKGRIFSILAFSLIITASICYSLENFGISMGLWSWRIYFPEFEPFLMNCPLHAIEGWVHMSMIFLSLFFITECSRYKSAKWKPLCLPFLLISFILLPFLNLGGGILRLDLAAIGIIFFSFLIKLRMECRHERPAAPRYPEYINLIPLIVILSMASFMIIYELFILRHPPLVISIMPMLIVALLSVTGLPLLYIFIFSAVMLIVFGEKAAFAAIPAVFAVVLAGADRLLNPGDRGAWAARNTDFLKTAAFTAGLIAYLTFSFQTVIFLKNIEKIAILPRVLMSVYKGPAVTISGNIICGGCGNRPVLIRAVTLKPEEGILRWEDQFEIAQKILPAPGHYEIRVPARIGRVYMMASNIDVESGVKILPPALLSLIGGEYEGNPLAVGTANIEDVDIEISGGYGSGSS